MKTKITILMLCLASSFCVGQEISISELNNDTVNHLVVKGLPICGYINDFVDKLVNAGFSRKIGATNEAVPLEGVFVGKPVRVYVKNTPITKTVYSVIFIFDGNGKFWSAKVNFNEMVYSYMSKYGTPTNIKRDFIRPFYEGDGYEDVAMKNDKIEFYATWVFAEGIIIMYINNNGSIIIVYEDDINSILNESEKQYNINLDI